MSSSNNESIVLSEVVEKIRECRSGYFTTTAGPSKDFMSKVSIVASDFPIIIIEASNFESHFWHDSGYAPELLLRPEMLPGGECVILKGVVDMHNDEQAVFVVVKASIKSGLSITKEFSFP